MPLHRMSQNFISHKDLRGGKCYECHLNATIQRPAPAFAGSHPDHLPERSEVRISEESSPARLHPIGAQLSSDVLRAVWTGAQCQGIDWEHNRSDLPDRNLRHVWPAIADWAGCG